MGFGLGAWALAFSAGAGRAMLIASHAEMVLIGFAAQFTLGVAWSSFPRLRGSRGNPLTMRGAYVLLNAGLLVMLSANVVVALPENRLAAVLAPGSALSPSDMAAVGGTLVVTGGVLAASALWKRVRPV
jgi:hypothetical protein